MSISRGTRQPTVALHTLGCKLNQYETEVMRERFEQAGYRSVRFDEVADVYVVNSCTVTASSDRDTRRLARQGKRRNPEATVVVAGCYAQTDVVSLRTIEGIDLIIGNHEKADVVSHVAGHDGTTTRAILSDAASETVFRDERVSSFARHTRAFLKIQDGCNLKCSYCKVRLARGPSRSRPLRSVIEQAAQFVRAGHAEVVLVGVHLALYGQDLAEPTHLTRAVRRVLEEVPDLARLRLSSLHPREVGTELISLVAESDRVCRHFHLPVQSGDDDVLRAMRRPYRARDFADKVMQIASRVTQVGIGADVMVGFPGETEAQFQRTVAMVRRLPLTYLHVFSFSARPGTAAAEMSDQVPPEARRQRMRTMRRLSQEKSRAFQESLVGTTQHVLVEQRQPAGRSGMSGLTDNYVRVCVENDSPVGEVVPVSIIRAAADALIGQPL